MYWIVCQKGEKLFGGHCIHAVEAADFSEADLKCSEVNAASTASIPSHVLQFDGDMFSLLNEGALLYIKQNEVN